MNIDETAVFFESEQKNLFILKAKTQYEPL